MAKHLRIEVNGMIWVDGNFDEMSFYDGPNGVRIEGKNAARPAGGSGSLMDLFTGASRSRTEAMVKEKRRSLVEADEAAQTAEVLSE